MQAAFDNPLGDVQTQLPHKIMTDVPQPPKPTTPLGWLIALWGAIGVAGILGFAIVRLTPVAIASLSSDLQWFHWLAYPASVVFMGYTEGYKAFQLQYSPRVVARALHLGAGGLSLSAIVAPLFCMGFFGATKKRLVISYAVTFGIVCLIIGVKLLPQPWRGIVDVGVVVGLGWGTLAIAWFWVQTLRGEPLPVPSDVG